ncbi:hypothetical protein K1719_033921 [Acacia pycnantha]|nr:hypothetical protein K1719_033921 [Acacia pycnantha]
MVANMVPSVKSNWPSARERNLLKRKAKMNSKDQTKGRCEDGSAEASLAQNATSRGTYPDSVNCWDARITTCELLNGIFVLNF